MCKHARLAHKLHALLCVVCELRHSFLMYEGQDPPQHALLLTGFLIYQMLFVII